MQLDAVIVKVLFSSLNSISKKIWQFMYLLKFEVNCKN